MADCSTALVALDQKLILIVFYLQQGEPEHWSMALEELDAATIAGPLTTSL